MRSSISKTVAVLAVGIPLAHALDFHFPSTVTAGESTDLTADTDNGAPFRVSLVIAPPGSSDNSPVCWLVNSTAADTTSLKITIPTDIGPSGPYYALAGEDVDGDDSVVYTDSFTLEGGTAEWSPAELAGVSFGDDTVIPCTSYNCVRNCTLGVNLLNPTNMTAKEGEAQSKAAYECMAACPGINVPSWNETYGGEISGDDDSDSSSSSSSSYEDALTVALTMTISGEIVVVATTLPNTASANPTATITSSLASTTSRSTSTSAPTSGTSNSTVPTVHPNAASQIAASIPILFSLVVGVLLM